MAELIQQDRCRGGGTVPTTYGEERARDGHLVRLGMCPECDAWIGLTSNGKLMRHVNWNARNRRLKSGGRVDG